VSKHGHVTGTSRGRPYEASDQTKVVAARNEVASFVVFVESLEGGTALPRGSASTSTESSDPVTHREFAIRTPAMGVEGYARYKFQECCLSGPRPTA
jgi:hypothetical protein